MTCTSRDDVNNVHYCYFVVYFQYEGSGSRDMVPFYKEIVLLSEGIITLRGGIGFSVVSLTANHLSQ